MIEKSNEEQMRLLRESAILLMALFFPRLRHEWMMQVAWLCDLAHRQDSST